MDLVIKKITKEYLKSHIESFLEILKNEPYEYWNEENFLIDLPGKYDISYYLELDEVLASYIISSLKPNNIAYIHKFMTSESYRNKGLGRMILNIFQLNCKQKKIKEIQLTVIKSNNDAIEFYINNGFTFISNRLDKKNNIELLLMGKKQEA